MFTNIMAFIFFCGALFFGAKAMYDFLHNKDAECGVVFIFACFIYLGVTSIFLKI